MYCFTETAVTLALCTRRYTMPEILKFLDQKRQDVLYMSVFESRDLDLKRASYDQGIIHQVASSGNSMLGTLHQGVTKSSFIRYLVGRSMIQ